MSKQELVEQKIKFYKMIYRLMRCEVFDPALVRLAMELYEPIKSDLALDMTEDELRLAHQGNHADTSEGFEMLKWVVETAWSDLATHMRSPDVRRVFGDLRWLIDPERQDLFIHTSKLRHLTKRSDGSAVITLVVDDAEAFDQFLNKGNTIESVHHTS